MKMLSKLIMMTRVEMMMVGMVIIITLVMMRTAMRAVMMMRVGNK